MATGAGIADESADSGGGAYVTVTGLGGGRSSEVTPTPPERIHHVDATSRVVTVEPSSRTVAIPASSRVIGVRP